MSRQIKDPISGSWLTTAGYAAIDNALDPNSRNPVQNKIVTEQFNAVNTKVGELSNLDTTDKSNIVAAINELKGDAVKRKTTTSNSTSYSIKIPPFYMSGLTLDGLLLMLYIQNGAAKYEYYAYAVHISKYLAIEYTQFVGSTNVISDMNLSGDVLSFNLPSEYLRVSFECVNGTIQ